MRIGLFASDHVGLCVIEYFRRKNFPLACIVLDSKNRGNKNPEIISAFKRDNRERIFYSDSLYTKQTLDQLKSLQLDLIVLAWWSYIVKSPLLNYPKHGIINLHPSYLPYNRGRDAKYWTIIEDTPFGSTIHFIDSGIDSGDIIFQEKVDKSWEDTGESLYRRSEESLINLFKMNFEGIIAGNLPRIPQSLEKGSFYKKVDALRDSEIQLDETVKTRDLLNRIRAKTSSLEPGAWFVEDGQRYEVKIEIKKIGSEHNDD